jgi:hypothetical protein
VSPEARSDRAFHVSQIGIAFIAEEVEGAFCDPEARVSKAQKPCAACLETACAETACAETACVETEPCAGIGLMSFEELSTEIPYDIGFGDTFTWIESR